MNRSFRLAIAIAVALSCGAATVSAQPSRGQEVQRELGKLDDEHRQKMLKIGQELNEKLRKADQDYRKDPGGEQRRKLDEKVDQAYATFDEKRGEESRRYDEERGKILRGN